MFHLLLRRVIPLPESPTSDLYFANACSDFLESGVTRLAPTVFASASACLVMRHSLGAREMNLGRRLIYLIDDQIEEGVADSSLPFLYRQKLRVLERPAGRRLAPLADVAVVSSPALARGLPDRTRVRQIDPFWSEPIADQRHFEPLLDGRGWIDIAFLGSTVHSSDLEFLWPVLAAILRGMPRARFHLSERHHVPATLSGHPRICRIGGRGWSAYRAGLADRRFHLALYPLLDTPFNRARSVNKLIEHGVVGAAALYSRSWAESHRVSGGAGLVLDNRREDWLAAIGQLVENPSVLRDLAAGAGALARSLNRAEPQRRLWSELMGIERHAA